MSCGGGTVWAQQHCCDPRALGPGSQIEKRSFHCVPSARFAAIFCLSLTQATFGLSKIN
jgi:hypothetical protein